jgi:uncharacterized protein with FMN-binding domain
VKHFLPALIFVLVVAFAVNTGVYVADLSTIDTAYAEEESDDTSGAVKKIKEDGAAQERKAPQVHPVSTNLADCVDGIFVGTGVGYAGYIKVEVEIANHVMTSIKIIDVEADDAPYLAQAERVIDSILNTQSINVDTVSGATFSSNGIIMAVADALSQAAGKSSESGKSPLAKSSGKKKPPKLPSDDLDGEKYKDGIYYGTAKGFNGNITVKVGVKSQKITSIKITKHKEDLAYLEKALQVIATILKTQSTNVDAVSGATYSSNGIILAVRDALKKAVNGNQSDDTGSDDDDSGGSLPDADDDEGEDLDAEYVPEYGQYIDGDYYGSATGYGGAIIVRVSVSDNNIKEILVTRQKEDEPYFTRCMIILSRIVKRQTTAGIDTVSGATYTSKGLLGAVNNALLTAKRTDLTEDAG